MLFAVDRHASPRYRYLYKSKAQQYRKLIYNYQGASGVLGSAIYSAFKTSAEGHDVLGTAHSRAQSHPELRALDLLDEAAVEELVREWHPRWVVHCAAERRPDVAERDPAGAKKVSFAEGDHLGYEREG